MSDIISRRNFLQAGLAAPFILSAMPQFAGAAEAKMTLSGFADEISPKLDEQIRVCKSLGVRYFELRGVEGKTVPDLSEALRKEVRDKLKDNGMGVACIGSPIGKIKVTDPWQPHFDKFKKVVELAEYLDAPLIRLFSYFPASKNDPVEKHRDEVMKRMQAKTDYVKDHPVTLVHENEKEIYGERGPACLDILKTINSPKLRCAFDFANFVQAGDNPLDNWKLLKDYVVHIHIKDCKKATKKVVPAGQGDGHLLEILTDAKQMGYHGFLSLEPHLKVAGKNSGETGPELFKVAVDALRGICKKADIQLA